jgi:hypothetical protein
MDYQQEKDRVLIERKDLVFIARCLALLEECPPSIRAVVEAGDAAIDAAGINPWTLNEGTSAGDEACVPWFMGEAKAAVLSALG